MKQEDKRRITQQNFTEAFWKLYKNQDFSRISVNSICQSAGYHRSTFYEYYTDIYDLREHAEDQLIEKIIKGFSITPDTTLTQNFISHFTIVNNEYGDVLCRLLSAQGDPGFAIKIRVMLKPYFYKYFYISTADTEMDYVFDFLISSVLSFFATWYEKGKVYSTDKGIALIRHLLTHGITEVIAEHSTNPEIVKNNIF